MLGPVPAKYRLVVWLCGLAAFAGLGAWLSLSVPLSTTVMSSLGLVMGAAVVVIFLHDFERSKRAPARIRRPR